jgi:hypothetical protein
MDATRTVCRGCYCETPESLEAAEQRKRTVERKKLAAIQKSKVQELEKLDGNCIMTSRKIAAA